MIRGLSTIFADSVRFSVCSMLILVHRASKIVSSIVTNTKERGRNAGAP